MKQEMTSYERVMAVVRHEKPDMIPAINPTSNVCLDSIHALHIHYPAAHIEIEPMMKLAEAGHDLYGFDCVSPYFSTLLETSALGSNVNWGDDLHSPVVTEYSLKKIEDLNIPADFISKKEFQHLLTCIDQLHKHYQGEVAVIGKVIGPWTLAYQLYGVEKLVMDTILNPEKTKQFIRELSIIPLTFAQKQFEAGADLITWAEHCTSDLVSAQIYKEFVAPIHKQAAHDLQSYGPLILHTCGNLMDRLENIADTGIQILHIDSRNNLKEAAKQVDDRLILVGSVNNPYTLSESRPQHVRDEVIENILDGVKMIAPECNIPVTVPGENLSMLVAAAHGFKERKS